MSSFSKHNYLAWLSVHVTSKRGYIENVPCSGREQRCTRQVTRTLLRIVRNNSRSSLKDVTAKFNNRAILNYSIRSIRRRRFDSGSKPRHVSKNITIGSFNRERRLRFCNLKINRFVENDWAKIILSAEAKIEVGADKKIYVWRKRMNGSTLTVGVVPVLPTLE